LSNRILLMNDIQN